MKGDDMRAGSHFTVAIHALMLVSFFDQDKITSKKVAMSIGCNPVIVRNVFVKLGKAGLLRPGMGRARTKMMRPPEEITLEDVYHAVESDDVDEMFRMYPVNPYCPIGSELHEILDTSLSDARDSMLNSLSRTTIADLISRLPPEKNRVPVWMRD